jgi:hypothetical protein
MVRKACIQKHIDIINIMVERFGLPKDRKIFLYACKYNYANLVNMYLQIRKIDNTTKQMGLGLSLYKDHMNITNLLLLVTGDYELPRVFQSACLSKNIPEAILIISVIINKFPDLHVIIDPILMKSIHHFEMADKFQTKNPDTKYQYIIRDNLFDKDLDFILDKLKNKTTSCLRQ